MNISTIQHWSRATNFTIFTGGRLAFVQHFISKMPAAIASQSALLFCHSDAPTTIRHEMKRNFRFANFCLNEFSHFDKSALALFPFFVVCCWWRECSAQHRRCNQISFCASEFVWFCAKRCPNTCPNGNQNTIPPSQFDLNKMILLFFFIFFCFVLPLWDTLKRNAMLLLNFPFVQQINSPTDDSQSQSTDSITLIGVILLRWRP